MSVGSDWYDYIRTELIAFEERAGSLASDVDVKRGRLGAEADRAETDALAAVHRHLVEASEQLHEARRSVRALRSGTSR